VNSIHRTGLALAGLSTLFLMAGVFAVQTVTAGQIASVATVASANPASTPAPEIVYVNPAPTPAVINVTQTSPPAQRPALIHLIVRTHDDGNEGSDDR
jgi:hypothetical protein